MKVVELPVRIFETGDRVYTPEGWAKVIHDELETRPTDFMGDDDAYARHWPIYQSGVIVQLEEPTSSHPRAGEDVTMEREYLITEQEYSL